MSTTTNSRRSELMQVLRVSAVPLVLGFLGGGFLTAVGFFASAEWGPLFRDVGYHALVLCGLLLVAVLWGGVYLEVVEASRGMPGLRPVEEPAMTPEAATQLRALERSLSALGFRHDEWFSLDNFPQTHVSAWQHERAAAFILYYPEGGMFRLRFYRRFASGGVLISSTRVNDLACPSPQGIYVQAKKGASVEELWAWHLEGESLFPDATGAAPGDTEAGGPRELFVAVAARWAGHWRRDRTWLLAIEPFGECWRMYHLCGMPLSQQFELGWTNPYWQ